MGREGFEPPTFLMSRIYSPLPSTNLAHLPKKKYKRNRENFYWVLHFSYLHKDTLTLFRLTIINSLPFNSLQVPELDFLIFPIVRVYCQHQLSSTLIVSSGLGRNWTYVYPIVSDRTRTCDGLSLGRLTVCCLRPLDHWYIFYLFQKTSNFLYKSFWIIKNLFPRFS